MKTFLEYRAEGFVAMAERYTELAAIVAELGLTALSGESMDRAAAEQARQAWLSYLGHPARTYVPQTAVDVVMVLGPDGQHLAILRVTADGFCGCTRVGCNSDFTAGELKRLLAESQKPPAERNPYQPGIVLC